MNDTSEPAGITICGSILIAKAVKRLALRLLIVLAIASAARSVQADDFDSTVAPLLARRCLGCHNQSEKKGGLDLSSAKAVETGGDSGPVLVSGELD